MTPEELAERRCEFNTTLLLANGPVSGDLAVEQAKAGLALCAEVERLQAEREHLREVACCPPDVPFETWLKMLAKAGTRGQALERVAELARNVVACFSVAILYPAEARELKDLLEGLK